MRESKSSYVLQKIHFCYALYKKKTANQKLLKFNILLYNHVYMCYQEKVMKNFLNKSTKLQFSPSRQSIIDRK